MNDDENPFDPGDFLSESFAKSTDASYELLELAHVLLRILRFC